MKTKKKFFQNVENQKAFFIALFVALLLLAIEMISTAAEWAFSIGYPSLGQRWGSMIGYIVSAIGLLIFISKFEKKFNL